MDVAIGAFAARLIELVDQGTNQCGACRVGGAKNQGVAARLGQQGGFVFRAYAWTRPCIGRAGGLNQATDQRR